MVECVVVQRLRPNMGRDQDKTYVNVVFDARQFALGTSLADWLAATPTSIWNDPTNNEFVVEITEVEFQEFKTGVKPIFYGPQANVQNEPLWQQENAGSLSVASIGSFADPESAVSAFTAGVPLDDDRFIVRLFTNSNRTGQVDFEQFEEDIVTRTVERFVGLYNPSGTENSTNLPNQLTEIAGFLVRFDFGSSDGLPPGVARLDLEIFQAGRGQFNSNHRYKVLTSVGEDYGWDVFKKSIGVATEF